MEREKRGQRVEGSLGEKKRVYILGLLLFLFSLLLVIVIAFFVRDFLKDISLAPFTIQITDCGNLDQSDTEYLLLNDITVTDSCFVVSGDNIIFNGQNYKITYGTSGSDDRYAFRVDNTDYMTIRNVTIEDGNILGEQDYPIYSSNNIGLTIENTTINAFNSTIINLVNSNFSVIRDNSLNGMGSSGVQLRDSGFGIMENNAVILSPLASSPDKIGRALYLVLLSNSNLFRNNVVSTSGQNQHGINIQGGSNNVFRDVRSVTSGDGADALRFIGGVSSNNTFERVELRTSGSGGADPLIVSSISNSFLVRDSIINSVQGSDFVVGANANGGVWDLVNVSLTDKTWSAGANGTLNVYWYFDSQVVDNSANALVGVSVSAVDAFGNNDFSELTDSSGNIGRKTLAEYSQVNGDAASLYTDYILTYSKNGYGVDTDPLGLGTNRFIQKQLEDLQGPTINIVSPLSQTYITNTSLVLKYIAEDFGGRIDSCEYNFDNGQNIPTSCSLDTTFDISNGLHTLYVFARDIYGNVGISNVTFQISTDVPSVTLDFPTDGQYMTAGRDIYLRYTPNDGESITGCSLYLGSTLISLNETDDVIIKAAQNNFGPFNFSEGIYRWNVLCSDSSNNQDFALNNFSFIIDVTKPVISDITKPLAYPANSLCSRNIQIEYYMQCLIKYWQ